MTTSAVEPPDLRLSDGATFLGEYKNSGLKEAPYIIRRGDGHILYVSRLIYLVAWGISRSSDAADVASLVSRSYSREVSADNVRYLAEHKLASIGLLASEGPGAAPPVTANPLLALRLRLPLVPERVHRVLSTGLTPLFWPPFIVAALTGLVIADVWLLGTQATEIFEGMQMMFFEPRLLLVITLLTLTAGAFHEFGHAAAARYGGAVPGAMGAGVYIVWPVFYTDVSDTYRLDRRGRLRTDLGGLYFNVLFILGSIAAYGFTGYPPLLVLAVLIQFESLRQFLPFIRLDGYWVMSDLAGVPNLFSYMGPVLTVLVRRRDPVALEQGRHKLNELTRRARVLIMGWVLVTVPVIAVNVVLFLFILPRLAGLAWGSAWYQVEAMTTATGAITPVGVANGLINLLLLALPVLGITYLLGLFLRRGVGAAVRWWPQRPALTGAATALASAAFLAQVGLNWPSSFADTLDQARSALNSDNGGRFELTLEDSSGWTPLDPSVSTTPEAPAVGRDLDPEDGSEEDQPGEHTSDPLTDTEGDGSGSGDPGSPDSPPGDHPTRATGNGRVSDESGNPAGPAQGGTAEAPPSGERSSPSTGGSPTTTPPSDSSSGSDSPPEAAPEEPEEDNRSGLRRLTEAFFGLLSGG